MTDLTPARPGAPDITIISIPLSFEGPARVRQVNALRSWRNLGPRVTIALYGDEVGMVEVCAEFMAVHIPEVRTNEKGTPLVSAALQHAARTFDTRLLLFANSDILLCDDLLPALDGVALDRFLIVGNRTNMEVQKLLDFAEPDAAAQLRIRAQTEGVMQPPVGSDYFIFPRETAWQMPELAVGRLGWDNWMIFRAREMGLPVIDATPSVTAVHQNHDYRHVKSRPAGSGIRPGHEDNANQFTAGGVEAMFTLWDVDFQLVDGQLLRPRGVKYSRRRIQSGLVLNPATRPAYRLVRSVWAAARIFLRRHHLVGPGTDVLSR